MRQTWRDLLFMHWPVPVEAIRQRIPPGLAVDTFEGRTWLAVVPFRMSGVRPRHVPPIPWLSAFPELNVRAYVVRDGRPGVWFFSLEAGNPAAVAAARRLFHLPYFRARMALRRDGARIRYTSRRAHRGAPAAEFAGAYGPTGAVYRSRPGTLEHWLTERYCLYAADAAGRVYRGEIHHDPWPLQPAEADIGVNTMAASHGLALPGVAPLLHFARKLEVVVWPLERVHAA
jgi:uncharacterized protein YqjF (DUF2071 family)